MEFKQYIFSAQRPRARLILNHFYPGHLTDQERMRYRNEVGRTDFERKIGIKGKAAMPEQVSKLQSEDVLCRKIE